jgi:hypothetical protein
MYKTALANNLFLQSMKKLYYGLIILATLLTKDICAQNGDITYYKNIRTTKLYKTGDQTSFPALLLNRNETLELHFDDLDADVKTYYYTFQLCNSDWSPSILRTQEYTRGFQNVRITNYRNSSLAFVRYTHYQASVPDRNSFPTRSGNYLLKVFLNGDTSRVAFTKRFVVVDMKSSVAAQILQPFNATLYNTAQKLQIGVQTDPRVQLLSPTDLKVVAIQNNSWLTSVFLDRPTITRGNYYEYSDEAQNSFPAIKEFRWVDLRSFRLKGDHIQTLDAKRTGTDITVVPDPPRATQVYSYYRDLNGGYTVENVDNPNPILNGDYATVHFRYFPPGNRAIEGQDLYLFGEFTNYAADTSGRMTFNAERGAYEKTLFLKQGYYNYTYATLPMDKKGYPDFSQSEGNYWATENAYVILVYYRPFGARADELIGFTFLNSAFQRP